MEWVNLHISVLDSPECGGSSPGELGTWLRVLAYACKIECGGRIPGASKWKDRQWQHLCGVTIREVKAADRLLRFVGEDVEVNGYPVAKEAQVQAKRGTGMAGAMGKWRRGAGVVVNAQTRSQRLSESRKLGTHTDEEWAQMLSAFSRCVRCGARDREIVKDHILPIYQGGSDSITNLQPLCRTCNASKGPESTDHRIGKPECLPKWFLMPTETPATGRHQAPAEGEGKGREQEGEGEGKIAALPEPDHDIGFAPQQNPPKEPVNPNLQAINPVECARKIKQAGGQVFGHNGFDDWKSLVEDHGESAVLEAIRTARRNPETPKPRSTDIAEMLARQPAESAPDDPDPLMTQVAEIIVSRGWQACRDLLELPKTISTEVEMIAVLQSNRGACAELVGAK